MTSKDLQISETRDIAACHELRRIVFMVEQNVPPHEEFDGKDDEAVHLLATLNGAPIGTARLLRDGDLGKIGRVCVLKEGRGTGIGAALIRTAVSHFREAGDVATVKLGAQTHALGFYERLGFEAYGPEYLDAGILHRDMKLSF